MEALSAQELLAPAEGGRVFTLPMHPGLGDCSPSGRMRLDAIARWLQDVAYADVEDAGVQDAAVWVVRRARVRVNRFPRFAERFAVSTFCSGIGRMWAERRTTIRAQEAGEDAGQSAAVEAVALWVHLDPNLRRPTPLSEHELAVYGNLGHDRKVSARLRHPLPAGNGGGAQGPTEREWLFRAVDCDLADHVNNAAYWQPLEEELLAGPEPSRLDVEIEFRGPAQPGPKVIVTDGERRWIRGEDGEVHASMWLLERG